MANPFTGRFMISLSGFKQVRLKRTELLSSAGLINTVAFRRVYLCVFVSDMTSDSMYPSLFMSALTATSDRTLSLCWEQHCKLLPGVAGIHASQVASWSVEEVGVCYTVWNRFNFITVPDTRICSLSGALCC